MLEEHYPKAIKQDFNVDKKMNNKLICFNNVLDDYLFFYDKTKKDDY